MIDPERAADPTSGSDPGPGDVERPGRSSFLPPPAFPPGSRRRHAEATGAPAPAEDPAEDAFISPDAPLPPRGSRTEEDDVEVGEAVPAGMGAGHAVDPSELRAAGDPWVLDLTERMERLAQALRQRGEAGLHTDPEMDRFDATLRAYCVGYLAGRRAGGDA